ncbi:MAG: hypothetical protein JXJ20_11125 [Anaerolineae bacterium]|jgi:hypothetical protein|nr:hypothetical protein [Anaerolineae bacterium]
MQAHPHRFAWITLIGALVIFCLLCIGTIAFVRWLLLESPTELSVTVHVGRGTVGLAEPETSDEKAVRGEAQLGSGDRLSTDNVSQGYLAFSDPYSGKILATVTLHHDTIITLDSANRPRFSLSDNAYTIRLTEANGQLDVWVNSGLTREIRLNIESALGVARISQSGNYFLESNPSYFKATARSGALTLIDDNGQTQHLASTTEATIYQGDPVIRLTQAPTDLLPNSTFTETNDSAWPVAWSCANYPSPDNPNGPTGKYEFTSTDGRPTLHIQRLQSNPGPGGTGCEQFLAGPEGLDVSQYDSLVLRASMMVHYQKLSACGVAGSECPVMLYISYLDQDGNPREWYHGFYAEYTPSVGRTRCDTCLEEHERINKDAWYTYESGNLFTDLPEGQRPGSIIQVRFYASGHEYEIMINEVALLATLPAEETAAAP